MTNDTTPSTEEQATGEQTPDAVSTRRQRMSEKARALLTQLAEWHPQLFGEVPVPLKRGIFQDLTAAHQQHAVPENAG